VILNTKKSIVISSPEYVRNYISTDAFARIEKMDPVQAGNLTKMCRTLVN
jgi:hypothetical protein